MVDNVERIADAVERIEQTFSAQQERQERAAAAMEAFEHERQAPRAATGWPWAPGTQEQGFLSARWERRDGNVYGAAALRGLPGPNSPIRGGDDSGKEIDVPSGARRS